MTRAGSLNPCDKEIAKAYFKERSSEIFWSRKEVEKRNIGGYWRHKGIAESCEKWVYMWVRCSKFEKLWLENEQTDCWRKNLAEAWAPYSTNTWKWLLWGFKKFKWKCSDGIRWSRRCFRCLVIKIFLQLKNMRHGGECGVASFAVHEYVISFKYCWG